MTVEMEYTIDCIWHPMPDEVRRRIAASRRASLANAFERSYFDSDNSSGSGVLFSGMNKGVYVERAKNGLSCSTAARGNSYVRNNYTEDNGESFWKETSSEMISSTNAFEREELCTMSESDEFMLLGDSSEDEFGEVQVLNETEPQDAQYMEVQPLTAVDDTRGKTKHTILFRGQKWANVLKNSPKSLDFALKRDVVDATGLCKNRIENLHFEFTDKLAATFIVRQKDDTEHMAEVHMKLRSWRYPHMLAIYSGKTKHTILFRGQKWVDVLKSRPKSLKSAVKRDVADATGLREDRIEKLHFEFTDKLVATFIVRHKDDAEHMAEVHRKLRPYYYPYTTALYQ